MQNLRASRHPTAAPRRGTPVLAAALAAAALAGCHAATPRVDFASGTVGPAAARIDLPGYASLQIPAGAVVESTTVTLGLSTVPVATPAPSVSPVISFTPHGTQFRSAVTMNVAYDRTHDSKRLTVMRLADDHATAWEPVGGATFSDGVASFPSTRFSYYAVVDGYACTPVDDAVACSAACECCGSAACVDLATDPRNCGACGNDCGASGFCAAGGRCVALSASTLCENSTMYVLQGEISPDLKYVSPEQTRDGIFAATVAEAVGAHCGITPVTVSQAAPGILDACTDAPLLRGGSTILLVGGGFGQRLARYLEQTGSPVTLGFDEATRSYAYLARSGAVLTSFPEARVNPTHDYFVVSLEADAARGALVLQIWGLGWEGTPAAVWYFTHELLPSLAAGQRDWNSYLLVEWTDDGDGAKGAGDAYVVLARDVP